MVQKFMIRGDPLIYCAMNNFVHDLNLQENLCCDNSL
jgi:hypothetical protein